MSTPSAVRIGLVHPDLLGTYGDGGNATVLAARLRWRGFAVEVIEIESGSPVPATIDIYCLGGGEDGPQARAAAELLDGRPLHRAVEAGAAVLAVCAGFQVVGESFAGADGSPRPGLGLLDVHTTRGTGPRAVGEVVADMVVEEPQLPPLTGYENHGGVTALGPDAAPLARVRSGTGNGAGDGTEGAIRGRVVATYLHGPVLARNPALADLLLSFVVGTDALTPLPEPDAEAEVLRGQRLAVAATEANQRARPSWWRRLRPNG